MRNLIKKRLIRRVAEEKDFDENIYYDTSIINDALLKIGNGLSIDTNCIDEILVEDEDATSAISIIADKATELNDVVDKIEKEVKEYLTKNKVDNVDEVFNKLKQNKSFCEMCRDYTLIPVVDKMINYLEKNSKEILSFGVEKAKIDELMKELKETKLDFQDSSTYIFSNLSHAMGRGH